MDYKFSELPEEELKSVKLNVASRKDNPTIEGVYYKKLNTIIDGRGDLTELWSEPWTESENVEKNIKHVYFNTTHEGIVKAWHVHEHTTSQYTCVVGKMQIVLVDIRPNSKTYGDVNQFIIGAKNPSFIRIPPGLLKGWKSLQGDSVIINFLTSADMKDNFRYPCEVILTDIWEPKNS